MGVDQRGRSPNHGSADLEGNFEKCPVLDTENRIPDPFISKGVESMVAHSKRKFITGTSLALAACLASGTAIAQTNGNSQDVTAGVETSDDAAIIVTGTRIMAPNQDAVYPVTSISADLIQRSGETNITDLLAESPALLGSGTSVRSSSSGSSALPGAAGVNTLNLRNLGTQRTLVLVNGRRHVASLPGASAIDINTIPITLIDRVDVLTGGASAVYGADAVSGVVNFILKRDFEGIELRGQNGISTRGDAEEYYGALTAGKNFASGAGNIAVSYEYRKLGRVAGNARATGTPEGFSVFAQNLADFPVDDPNVPDRILYNNVRFLNTSPFAAVDTNIDFQPDFTGDGRVYNRGLFLPRPGGTVQGGDSTPIAGFSGDLQPGVESHNANLLASYEFSPALRLFAEGKYVSTDAFTAGQPGFDAGLILYADNPFIPANIRNAIVPGRLAAAFGVPPGVPFPDGVVIFRDHFDFGRRSQRSERETWRGVMGVDGEIGENARYEIAYTYGKTTNRITDSNYRIADRYLAALDAARAPDGSIVCRSNLIPQATQFDLNYGRPAQTFTPGPGSGCSPVNVLGLNVASPESLAFFLTDLNSKATQTQHDVSAHIAGDFGEHFELPGGPVSFVLGGEYRKELSRFTPDQLLQDGVIAERVQVSPQSGNFDVWEGFAELQIPVLRDLPGAQLLQFGAAIRLSDYSSIGSTTTWKVDGTYAPVGGVRFRGTYSESVRAPDINELFAPQSGTTTRLRDPCDVVFVGQGTDFRAANCQTLLTGLGINPATFNPIATAAGNRSVNGIASGNLALNPEKAKTWTAGVVLQPAIAPKLVVSFDWHDIELTNAINTPRPQELVDLCVDQPTLDNPFCGNITRNPANGIISGFLVTPANVSRFRTSGADFSVNYSFEPGAGAGIFNLRLAGGYLDRLTEIATPGAFEVSKRRQPYAPKWNGSLDLAWSIGDFTANYGVNYFSKTKRFKEAEIAANPDIVDPRFLFIREKWEHDIQLAVDAYDERATFYGGVNNLFDRTPDFGEINYPVSFRGRFVYFGIKANIGDF